MANVNGTLKERIKAIRKAFALKQQEFADKLNIPHTAISKYERGEIKPSSDILAKIGEIFGVNLNWLLTGDGEMLKVHNNNSNVVKIPEKGEVECAAGNGCYVDNEEITAYIAFDKELLKRLGANIETCDVLRVKGNSMYPTLQTGDKVLVDRSQKEVIDDKLYIIRIEDKIKIKRLHKLTRGKLKVISDNKDLFEPEFLDPSKDDFEICGRVLWNIMFI